MSTRSLPKLLLSRKEVCEVTGFGLTKVTRLLRQGTIPSFMIEGQRRVRYSDLVEFVNSLQPDRLPTAAELAAEDDVSTGQAA